MKGLVLSGGGSKGAYVGGMLEYMKLHMGKEYDNYVSTSTGNLIQTLASLNDFDKLKEAYTSITSDDIYDISPFRKSSTHDNVKLNYFNILYLQLIKKQPTFGINEKLKDLIKEFFPEEKYLETLKQKKNLVSCVTNLSKVREEYYSSKTLGKKGYEKFVDWVWISTNAVPFTSLVQRNDDYYGDGGFMEHLPIQKAIDMGCTEIDCITTKPEKYKGDIHPILNNSLEVISRITEVMMWEMSKRDIDSALFRAKDKDVKVNIHYLPRKLTDNSMFFDKKAMSEWWIEGFEYAKSNNKKKSFCQTLEIKC